VVNSLNNGVANANINDFSGIVISGYGVSVTGLNALNHLIAAGGGTYTCGPGNVIMDLVGGNANILGGSGIDTVIMQGQKYTPIALYSKIDNLNTITTVYTNQGVSTLTNIEYLQFEDQTVAISVGVGQNAGEAYRIYQAAFNRTPDIAGLVNWIKQLDSGVSLLSVANAFINSPEFINTYGNNVSNSAFIKALYTNVLHRLPDAGGQYYWEAALAKGLTRAELLVNFSESGENVASVASLIGQGILFPGYSPGYITYA
jgi:hypothetical protein